MLSDRARGGLSVSSVASKPEDLFPGECLNNVPSDSVLWTPAEACSSCIDLPPLSQRGLLYNNHSLWWTLNFGNLRQDSFTELFWPCVYIIPLFLSITVLPKINYFGSAGVGWGGVGVLGGVFVHTEWCLLSPHLMKQLPGVGNMPWILS